MGDRFLVKNEIEEREVRFVGVRRRVIIRGERWGATNTTELIVERLECVGRKLGALLPVVDIGGRIRQTESVLNVQVCL